MTTSTARTVKPAETFTVYYRTGGTDNFKWQRTLERHTTQESAQASVNDLRKAGYKALYEKTSKLDAMGLPETFE